MLAYAGVAVFLGSQWEALVTNPLVLGSSVAVLTVLGWLAWRRVRLEVLSRP